MEELGHKTSVTYRVKWHNYKLTGGGSRFSVGGRGAFTGGSDAGVFQRKCMRK